MDQLMQLLQLLQAQEKPIHVIYNLKKREYPPEESGSRVVKTFKKEEISKEKNVSTLNILLLQN
jgi:hypothetical protein